MDEVVDGKVNYLVRLLIRETEGGVLTWSVASAGPRGFMNYLAAWEDASVEVSKAQDDEFIFRVFDANGDALIDIDTRANDSTQSTDDKIRLLYATIDSRNSTAVQLLDSLINRLTEQPPF